MATNTSVRASVPPLSSAHYLFFLIVIILLGYSLRLFNGMQYPISIDEMRHITRMHEIINGNTFAGLHKNKWLYGYLVSFFNVLGTEGAWIARWFNTLWASISIAAAVAIVRKLDSRRVGLYAGLFYAVAPLTVVYERRALYDPQMAALAALATLFMISLARRPRIQTTVLLVLALAFARLTKPTMVGFLFLPFVAVILFNFFDSGMALRIDAARRKTVLKGLLLCAAAFAAVLLIVEGVYIYAASRGVTPEEYLQVSFANTRLGLLFSDPLAFFYELWLRIRGTWGNYLAYWQIGMMTLLVLATILGVLFKQKRRELFFLFIPGVVFLAIPILAVNDVGVQARYLIVNGVGVAGMVALCVAIISRWATERNPSLTYSQVAGVLLAFGALPALYTSALTPFDRWGMPQVLLPFPDEIDWVGNFQFRHQVAQAIIADSREHLAEGERFVVLTTSFPQAYQPYFGIRNAIVIAIDGENTDLVPYYVNQGDRLYIISDVSDEGDPLPDYYWAYDMSLVHRPADEENETYGAYILNGLDGASADRVYDLLIADPLSMEDGYTALEATINGWPTADARYVFPAGHSGMLDNATPVEVGTFPLTDEAAQSTIEAIATNYDLIDVVLVDEAASDPNRIIATALHSGSLYTVTETWQDLLHVQRFAVGPSDPDYEPVNAMFEGVIHLTAAALIDEVVAPNSYLRLAVQWETDTKVQDAYQVFTHIVDQDGNLLAQFDGVPGNGLFPLTSWQPGETITDRYAISIPANASVGAYDVRIGVYNPSNGLRLQVDGGPLPDQAVIGSVVIEGTPNVTQN